MFHNSNRHLSRLLLSLSFIFVSATAGAQNSAKDFLGGLLSRTTLHGYAHVGYQMKSDSKTTENSFLSKYIFLIADAQITERWSARMMYGFNAGGVHDLYLDYMAAPWLHFRLGQFKTTFGMENPNSPATQELIDVCSQATNYFAGSAPDPLFGNHAGRDAGVKAWGNLLDGQLYYEVGLYNGQGINQKDLNNHKDLEGKLTWTFMKGLSMTGSFHLGKGHAVGLSDANPDIKIGDNYKRDRWALGAQYTGDNGLKVRMEYMRGKDGKVDGEGYYALACLPIKGHLEGILSYDYLNKNKDLGMSKTNYVAGLQYWFYDRCRVQAQYTYSDSDYYLCQHTVQVQLQLGF